MSILVNLANGCLSFFPANPRPRQASATAWEICICQADLTRPDPFNICPLKVWGGGSDPCSGVTTLVTHPATHHVLFQTYECAHCLQMLIICAFLSKTETTLHIYIHLTGLLCFTCWYLNILAVAGVVMSVLNVAIRSICIICSCSIITRNCSVVFVQDIKWMCKCPRCSLSFTADFPDHLLQKCTNPGRQVSRATGFCTLAPRIILRWI